MVQSDSPDNPPLKAKLTGSLNRILQQNLQPNETVLVALQAVCLEALVCTDRRVIKSQAGYYLRQTFGNNVFQLPYAAITSAQVSAHLLTGHFELWAGGI